MSSNESYDLSEEEDDKVENQPFLKPLKPVAELPRRQGTMSYSSYQGRKSMLFGRGPTILEYGESIYNKSETVLTLDEISDDQQTQYTYLSKVYLIIAIQLTLTLSITNLVTITTT